MWCVRAYSYFACAGAFTASECLGRRGPVPGRLAAAKAWVTLLALGIVVFAIGSLVIVGSSQPARATAEQSSGAPDPTSFTLVMIEEEGCAYCLKWHQEVGPGFPRSEEGRKAPLVTYDRRSREGSRFPRVVFTPTFILVRENKEVGRINGYPGADFFWSMLGDMLRKLEAAAPSPSDARR